MSATSDHPKAFQFPPVPARCVKDFEIPNEAIHADAELSKRMDECAMQLVRLSLLGIAGYGFLIKEIVAGSGGAMLTTPGSVLLFTGAACFAVALAFAFWSRELQVRCSGIQIIILRTFGKLENGGWSEGEIDTLERSLVSYREEQKDKLDRNRRCMRAAHLLLVAGAVSAVLCFGVVLMHINPDSKGAKSTPSISKQVGSSGTSAVQH
jgi:hypothetical protein